MGGRRHLQGNVPGPREFAIIRRSANGEFVVPYLRSSVMRPQRTWSKLVWVAITADVVHILAKAAQAGRGGVLHSRLLHVERARHGRQEGVARGARRKLPIALPLTFIMVPPPPPCPTSTIPCRQEGSQARARHRTVFYGNMMGTWRRSSRRIAVSSMWSMGTDHLPIQALNGWEQCHKTYCSIASK